MMSQTSRAYSTKKPRKTLRALVAHRVKPLVARGTHRAAGARKSTRQRMASAVIGIGGADVVKTGRRDTAGGSATSARSAAQSMSATGGHMANANATPAKHKRKGPSLADALEILTANLGMLVAAGAQVEHVVEGGVLTVRVNGVTERRDAEGVYFAPADEVTNGD